MTPKTSDNLELVKTELERSLEQSLAQVKGGADEGPPVLKVVPPLPPTLDYLIRRTVEGDHIDNVDLMMTDTGSRLLFREGSHVTIAMAPDVDEPCGYIDLHHQDALALAGQLVRAAMRAGATHHSLRTIDGLIRDTQDGF